jgi:CheY-like chemotaxis protein
MNLYDNQILMNMKYEMSQPVFNWKGKKILIVEDDYANYLLFHEILSCADACLIRAVSMQEAFDMLTSALHFDLLIIKTSIQGNEKCRSIKRIRLLWPELRIVAIAGGSACENRNKRCYPAGCDTQISHQLDGPEIMAVVDDLFATEQLPGHGAA